MVVTFGLEGILEHNELGLCPPPLLPVTVPVRACGQTEALHPALFPTLLFLN